MRGWGLDGLKRSLGEIYGGKTDIAQGRRVALTSSLLTAIYNVFITGIFYTGFLSMYGISITGVGIIGFIPYIANCFSVFSFSVLSRFKKRKPVLLLSRVAYYFLYIVATMVMPRFVMDAQQRLYWFMGILFAAQAIFALFSPGITVWLYHFYPEDSPQRLKYILYNSTFSSVLSSAVLLLGGVLTDAVAHSPIQRQLILGFRYFAFFLVAVESLVLARAREYPYPETDHVRLRYVFTLPFQQKKFLFCTLLMFVWNYNGNLNNGLWDYHLLNHLELPYTLVTVVRVSYTVILILLSPLCRRIIGRYSWVKAFGIFCLLWMPSEFAFFFFHRGTMWIFVPACLYQNMVSVGLNLSYANILYLNLPKENSTAYIAFNTIGCNFFAFLGLLTGTMLSGLSGDAPVQLLGMPVYSVQYTVVARGVLFLLIGCTLVRHWRRFTPDAELERMGA